MLKKLPGILLTLLFIFLLWYITAFWLDRLFFPPPFEVLESFLEQLLHAHLLGHFFISVNRVLLSLILSFLLAVPLGFFIGRNPQLDKLVSPLIYLIFPLPKIVFLPLIVVLFGLGPVPKILLIFLVVFFQILVSARDAARDIPVQWVLSIQSLHASDWQIYRYLIWPASLPKLITALRISLGTAIAVLFVVETFASTDGLGYFILDNMERQEIPAMYAGILAMGLLGITAYTLVDVLEQRYCNWS